MRDVCSYLDFISVLLKNSLYIKIYEHRAATESIPHTTINNKYISYCFPAFLSTFEKLIIFSSCEDFRD